MVLFREHFPLYIGLKRIRAICIHFYKRIVALGWQSVVGP
jgi:hypothetical protein